jgi:hypothetical protein
MRLKNNFIYIAYLIFFLLINSVDSLAQIGVGTQIIKNDIALQLESNDKGLLIPKVNLTGKDDIVTISPSSVEGLLVYNTSNTGIGNLAVNEGFYFWDGNLWQRMYNGGYSEHFMQTSSVTALNQTTIYPLTNLSKTLTLPYTGVYQVYVTAYYAMGNREDDNNFDATGYCEISLLVDGEKKANSFITSSSKRTEGGTFNKLAQQSTIVFNIDLEKGDHTFVVSAQEWINKNTENDDAYWGRNTSGFAGNNSGNNNGQRATLTVSLLRAF